MKKVPNGKIVEKIHGRKLRYTLTVEDCFGQYPLPIMEGVTIREIWDGDRTEEILESYNKIIYNKMKDTRKILKKIMMNILGDGLYRSPIPIDGIRSPHSFIIEIHGDAVSLKQWVKVIVSLDLIKESLDVSGDDSYYDYFPNYVRMFRSICKELNLPKIYKSTMKIILSNSIYVNDKGNTLPLWE